MEQDISYKGLPKAIKAIIWLIILLSVVFVGIYVIHFKSLSLSPETSDWAYFGDYIGGVLGPLFALASFLAIVITLILQIKELSLQRKEFELQREEMKQARAEYFGQKKALEKQYESLEAQRFETTLSTLLRRQNDIINSMKFQSVTGKQAIKAMSDSMKTSYTSWFERYSKFKSNPEELERIPHADGLFKYKKEITNSENFFDFFSQTHTKFYSSYQNIFVFGLNHYFRHLNMILNKIIHNIEQKELLDEYIGYVKAELSLHEQHLLFFEGLESIELKQKFEKYKIIENLPSSWLPDPSLANLYELDFDIR